MGLLKNKRAFTLAEVIIVFIIIGIVGTIAMATVKPMEKSYKYAYTKVFNSLSSAVYNHMSTTADVKYFDTSDGGGDSRAKDFCKALLVYMNTSDNAAECHINNDTFLGDNPSLADFSSEPNIMLSNGVYLWLGANGNKPFSFNQVITEGETDTISYYIIYADLNGKRGPNKIEYDPNSHHGHLPDIVAFIVTSKYIVIPVGYPKLDQRYLSAYVEYPMSEDEEDNNDGSQYSDAMTYYEAVVSAYGKGDDQIKTYGVVQTYDIEKNGLPNSKFRLVDNLDDYYPTPPHFDVVTCGDGSTSQQVKAENRDSLCDIKIFNYN